MIADLDGTDSNELMRTYVWGLDLSGTTQGAGGVGGLLMIYDGGSTYMPAYDGNGNVVALLNGSNGSLEAKYEFSPFGQSLRTSGSYSFSNPFKFSTKYQDSESEQYYYGFRFYSPKMGRFINRDPIEEAGGLNLYAFVGNDPVNAWDYLGKESIHLPPRFEDINYPFPSELTDPSGLDLLSIGGGGNGSPSYRFYSGEDSRNRAIYSYVYDNPNLGRTMLQQYFNLDAGGGNRPSLRKRRRCAQLKRKWGQIYTANAGDKFTDPAKAAVAALIASSVLGAESDWREEFGGSIYIRRKAIYNPGMASIIYVDDGYSFTPPTSGGKPDVNGDASEWGGIYSRRYTIPNNNVAYYHSHTVFNRDAAPGEDPTSENLINRNSGWFFSTGEDSDNEWVHDKEMPLYMANPENELRVLTPDNVTDELNNVNGTLLSGDNVPTPDEVQQIIDCKSSGL